MDEAMQARFEEKFKELLALAKKKKKNNILDYAEIQDALADLELEDEEIDKMTERLENEGVDILKMSDDEDEIDEIKDLFKTEQ